MNKTQMLKGILEGCVLKILEYDQLYSRQIVDTLKKYGFTGVSEGTVLPMLLRLDKEGLFNIKRVETSVGPNRKYYSLNEKGRKELKLFNDSWNELRSNVDSILNSEGEITL